MATSSRCSMCEKGQGTCLCGGCKKYFCMKDFKSHRISLSNEMDVIVGDRNDLQEKINNVSQRKESRSPLVAQIDEWEQNTIKKVQEIAEQARRQIKKIFSSKQLEIITQFEILSKELVQSKETEDFVEHDLARLRQKIKDLNQDLKLLSQPLAIELHKEQSDQIVWDRLIYVEEKSAYTDNREHNKQAIEKQLEILSLVRTKLGCPGSACPKCGRYIAGHVHRLSDPSRCHCYNEQ